MSALRSMVPVQGEAVSSLLDGASGRHMMYITMYIYPERYIWKELRMAAATERLVVQLTAKEKREIRRRARKAGLNVSEFVRRATTGTSDTPELDELLERTRRAAEESMSLIDDTLAFVASSNVRIAAMEAKAKSP